MDIKLLVVAENISVDKASNRFFAFSIIDDLITESLPILIPRCSILIIIEKDETDNEEHSIFVKVLNNDKLICDSVQQLLLFSFHKSRSIYSFDTITLVEEGKLRFEVHSEKGKLGEYEVNVLLREESLETNDE